MARAFYDDFDRSDGPIGNSWIADVGVWTIISGHARTPNSGRIHQTTQPLGANCCQRAWVEPPTSGTHIISFWFRSDVDVSDYKYVQFTIGTASVNVLIGHHVGGVNSNIATNTVGQYSAGTVDCMASVAGDQVIAVLNGYQVVAAQDPVLADNGAAYIYVGNSDVRIDAYALYDTGGDPFTVQVTPGTEEAPNAIITLTNGGADWTPGTPGAPVFEVGTGSIVSQTVIDENTAELAYASPSIDMPADIYDPQNDFFFRFTLTTDPTAIGQSGGGGGLTEAQADTVTDLQTLLTALNTQPGWETDFSLDIWGLILSTHNSFGTSENPAIDDIISTLLAEDGRLATIDAQSYSAMSVIDNVTASGETTLQNVIDYIRGTGAPTIKDVRDDIAALAPADSTDVTEILNAIAAIRTANLWSLDSVKTWIEAIETGSNQDVLDELALIRTANFWTLGHVMDAIADIPTTDYAATLSDIHADIAAIPTDPIRSLEPVTDAVSDLDGDLVAAGAAILAAIALIPTDPVHDLTEDVDAIASALGAVASAVSAMAAIVAALNKPAQLAHPPVWPGLANVTYGTPVDIAGGFTINAACHGVTVVLNDIPARLGSFNFDGTPSYMHVGAVAFRNDDGAYEQAQSFSFGKHILCPQLAVSASGAVGRVATGITGTATPWTINSA